MMLLIEDSIHSRIIYAYIHELFFFLVFLLRILEKEIFTNGKLIVRVMMTRLCSRKKKYINYIFIINKIIMMKLFSMFCMSVRYMVLTHLEIHHESDTNLWNYLYVFIDSTLTVYIGYFLTFERTLLSTGNLFSLLK
jgi:hypothetical protein